MKNINSPSNPDDPYENLSHHLIQIQIHIQYLENARSAILEEENKINGLIQRVQDLIASESENHRSSKEIRLLQKQITDPGLSLQDTLHSLEGAFTAFAFQYQQIIRTITDTPTDILLPDLDVGKSDQLPALVNIPKISLYLIHEDIYMLTRLIHHYTQFEYFRIYPYFTLSSALEQILSKTYGLILISSSLIREDTARVIRTIREHTMSMPIIVMADTGDEFGEMSGLNGTVNEECPLSEILELFLAGLRTQTSTLMRESRSNLEEL